jgi:hypothetical protein
MVLWVGGGDGDDGMREWDGIDLWRFFASDGHGGTEFELEGWVQEMRDMSLNLQARFLLGIMSRFEIESR